jgi:hypothetical protein
MKKAGIHPETCFIFLLSFVLCVAVFGNTVSERVEFVPNKNKMDVMIGQRLFTSYIFGNKYPKPMLVPILSPSGIEVTRRNPLTKIKGGSSDHQHHVGLFFAVDKVNGTNFWNNVVPLPQIKHIGFTEITSGIRKGKLSTEMNWIDKNGDILLQENRTMVFLVGEDDEYAIDFSIDLTARQNQVVFDDIEEGVFAVRVTDYLREGDSKLIIKSREPLPEESISGTGRYFSSNGDQTAKNVWGKRARWVALQGIKKGKVVGIAILNHPESINYPTYWHVRSYGLFSANPLGQGDFQRQSKYKKNLVIPLHLTLKQNQKVHFRFLVIVYEGLKTGEQIEHRFREFVK